MLCTNGSARAHRALGLWLTLGALGCGARGVVAGDAGADVGEGGVDVRSLGLRAFDVVAVVSRPGTGGGVVKGLSPTNRFTLVLDAVAHRMIVGANGTGSIVPTTTTDGKTFRVMTPFDTGMPPLGTCGSATRLTYQTTELTVAGTRLTGHATGQAQISCGDCMFMEAFDATFSAITDETPPTLVAATLEAEPFEEFSLSTSEPLPVGATARVVGGDGFGVALEPIFNDANLPDAERLVLGFSKPSVVLGVGGGYAVELDGLVDFAGLPGPSAAVRIGNFTPPPLVPADGFESATGTSVGGAATIDKIKTTAIASALLPLAGAQAVYVGRPDAPFAVKVGAGPRLLVRLAVPAGATKVVYKTRAIELVSGAGFGGSAWVGSVGKSFVSADAIGPIMTEGVIVFSDGTMLVQSEVQSRTLTLPSDVTDEVVFEIAAYSTGCGLPRPSSGLLIDDLRVE